MIVIKELDPLALSDGITAIDVDDFADVIHKVVTGCELVDIIMELLLLLVVECNAAIAVAVILGKPAH